MNLILDEMHNLFDGEDWLCTFSHGDANTEKLVMDAIVLVYLINELRSVEGSIIGIPCDNPKFGGVEITSDFTRWNTIEIEGPTLLDCLKKALSMKRKYDEQNETA